MSEEIDYRELWQAMKRRIHKGSFEVFEKKLPKTTHEWTAHSVCRAILDDMNALEAFARDGKLGGV